MNEDDNKKPKLKPRRDVAVTFKEANNTQKDHKHKRSPVTRTPMKKKSSISININVEENENKQQEINVEQSFGGQT